MTIVKECNLSCPHDGSVHIKIERDLTADGTYFGVVARYVPEGQEVGVKHLVYEGTSSQDAVKAYKRYISNYVTALV